MRLDESDKKEREIKKENKYAKDSFNHRIVW